MTYHRLLCFICLLSATPAAAQWQAGQVYREYHWVTPADHNEAFLRVGGRYGYAAQPGKLPADLQDGADLLLPHDLDLTGATRAEVTVEKVMSHEDSRNLTLSVNGYAPIAIGEPTSIPDTATEYMYHTDLTVPVPLTQLGTGRGVRFRLALDSTQRWGWPQNVLYDIAFRIYYAPASAPENDVRVVVDGPVDSLQRLTVVNASGARAVDYVFVGRGVDWSGRGTPRRTHWQTHRGAPHHTPGSSRDGATGFAVTWDTGWLPDQDDFGVQARVLRADGKYVVTPVTAGLRLAPRPYRVVLANSGPAPRNWVTRSGEFQQTISLPEPVATAEAYRLHWTSWSPCYSNGLFLNGHLVWSRTDDCYVYATHAPTYTGHALPYLQDGKNTVRTALTPLMRGQMVHGMEVQWPGVQLLVRYGR